MLPYLKERQYSSILLLFLFQWKIFLRKKLSVYKNTDQREFALEKVHVCRIVQFQRISKPTARKVNRNFQEGGGSKAKNFKGKYEFQGGGWVPTKTLSVGGVHILKIDLLY